METPLINGFRYDFGQIEVSIKGKKYVGIKEIKYSNKIEAADVYGAHAQKLGETRGRLMPEASMTMYREEYYELINALGDGYMEVRFEVTVSYGQDGDSVKTDKLTGVRVVGDESGGSEGTDALEVPVELKVMRIDLDNKNPLKSPLGGGNQGVNP